MLERNRTLLCRTGEHLESKAIKNKGRVHIFTYIVIKKTVISRKKKGFQINYNIKTASGVIKKSLLGLKPLFQGSCNGINTENNF